MHKIHIYMHPSTYGESEYKTPTNLNEITKSIFSIKFHWTIRAQPFMWKQITNSIPLFEDTRPGFHLKTNTVLNRCELQSGPQTDVLRYTDVCQVLRPNQSNSSETKFFDRSKFIIKLNESYEACFGLRVCRHMPNASMLDFNLEIENYLFKAQAAESTITVFDQSFFIKFRYIWWIYINKFMHLNKSECLVLFGTCFILNYISWLQHGSGSGVTTKFLRSERKK